MKIKAEKELILGCIKEDSSCQKEVYYKYAGKMFTICKRYARNEAEAEDFLQEGFMKVFDKISNFKFEGSFEGWIRRIIINTSISYCRKAGYNTESIGIEDYQNKSDQATAISTLAANDLLKIINDLPTGYRMVFNMYAIDGYSHKEIADELNITESTSRSQLAKARKLLQNRLIDEKKQAI